MELEKARELPRKPFLRLAGAIEGLANPSARKGFGFLVAFANRRDAHQSMSHS
jgi:hypothetical protein